MYNANDNFISITNKENNNYEDDIRVYKRDFQLLKDEGIIKNDKFDDKVWLLKNGNYNSCCKFDQIKNIKFVEYLRGFCINELKQYHSTHQITKNLNYIAKMVYLTNEFDSKYLNLIEVKFSSHEIKSETSIACAKFLEFLNKDEYNSYLDLFRKYNKRKSNIRKLPNYQSIIEFDYLLDCYFLDNRNKIEKYFPILLWWRITSVIPMRPIEFLTLEKKCCYEESGDYYLIINRRIKKETGNENRTIKQTLKVNKDIYMLISRYNDIVELNCKFRDGDYLLSYELYNINLKYPKASIKLKSNMNFLEMGQLYNLLKDFYTEVIYKNNNRKIEKIKLGDTRHLAFCNLMLQGLDPLTIAQIGFHKKLSTQVLYERHLDTFIYSYTYVLANRIKNIKSKSDLIQVNNIINRDEVILRSKLFIEDKNDYIRVGKGYCVDREFPLNCGNIDCIDCDYYILSNLESEYREDLSKSINKYLLKVKEDLITMRYLAKKVMHIKNNRLFEENKNTLLFMSKSIQRQIVKNANMIAQL